MSLAQQLLQFLVTGVTNGSIYALVALGFVIIYNTTGIINFAQGEFVMLGGLLAVSFHAWGLPMPLVLLASVAVVTVVGCALDRLALRPLRRASVISLIIVTIGASFSLRGAAKLVWGADAFRLPAFSTKSSFFVGGAAVRPQDFWVVGATAVALAAFYLFFRFTVAGKAMRACAINSRAAQLVGINVDRMILLSFALSAALSGLGGVVITPITNAEYSRGTALALKGFCGAIVGGLGSTGGAVLGGLLLGVLEALGVGFGPEFLHIPSGCRDVFSFGILLLMLFVRPSGLLGRRRREDR